ncbi:MAG: methyltransferase domain-containing protein [Gammaproteobacteria bacterium]|nr:methyltransferase domain-containing protein [Gammaproteobacteria bacterium]
MSVNGTHGYAGAIQQFVEAIESVNFFDLHAYCSKLFPLIPATILDIGSGIGRDAATFSAMGYTVITVEPCQELLNLARQSHPSCSVEWINDSLPTLAKIVRMDVKFDFILCSAVWHHIDDEERKIALSVVSSLLKPNGLLALTLRNGPAGVGTHVFPTDVKKTTQLAESFNLTRLLIQQNQPGLIANKCNVDWSKMVFQRSWI